MDKANSDTNSIISTGHKHYQHKVLYESTLSSPTENVEVRYKENEGFTPVVAENLPKNPDSKFKLSYCKDEKKIEASYCEENIFNH
ncbi:Hypothetical predicted protein [Octopus vulgaris]|uniref:Uncharacterized protein n=1 Tax=Octopus vulgaris TaxID=6645 RepID=A0AA36AUZ4_OCTVU|nr:Hypothetical predicted protein [Octopus vulgaris]